MLENPSNLFVVDLAVLATSDDSSAVLYDVYSYACFFLGTCLQSLPDTGASELSADCSGEAASSFHVSRKMLLNIIDKKIGLTRFTDVLKRRIALETKLLAPGATSEHKLFALEHLKSANFLSFMNSQREAIRKAIYDHYSGSLPETSSDSRTESTALAKVVELQKDEIARLTEEIENYRSTSMFCMYPFVFRYDFICKFR